MVDLSEPPVPQRLGALGRKRATVWVLVCSAILCQILHPVTPASGRGLLTVVTVVVFCSASFADAARCLGVRGTAALAVVAVGGGLAVEVVGLRTGFPFGTYAYGGTLGPRIAGIPAVVPLAWAMMAWPALVVGRVLAGAGRAAGARARLRVAVVGGWALAAWDVFLDPQMVDAGHWSWADPHPALPGVEGVPLTNFAGWLGVAVVMVALLDVAAGRGGHRRTAPPPDPFSAPAVTLYLWTYASSVMAASAFFGRPAVSVVGGVLMGLTALPLALRARSRSRNAAARRGANR